MRRAPTIWRRFRAWLGRYFWMPCPVCGEYFAGYEVMGLWTAAVREPGKINGQIVCPKPRCNYLAGVDVTHRAFELASGYGAGREGRSRIAEFLKEDGSARVG